MKDAAAGFARLEPDLDVIFSSPLVRAAQTAEIVARAIQYKGPIERMEQLSPGYSPDAVMQRVKSLKKIASVMLSGHEPNCSQLAEYLLGKADLEFKKGAICLIETETCDAGSGIMIWHLSPQVLRFMKS